MNTTSKTGNFASLSISNSLIQVAAELGYERPTAIQAASIPLLLEGHDLIGQSRTGSGKTVAFVMPILEKVNLSSRTIQALILCPTRELCTQVARETRKLGRKHSGLQVLILSGGLPMYPQKSALQLGVHIAVGTPGRVLDHLKRGFLNLNAVTTVVLDEADRMLEMGFEKDMEFILKAVPKKRQMVFFSATFPDSIKAISEKHQNNPKQITLAEEAQTAVEIKQYIFESENEKKAEHLLTLLKHHKPSSALIFCNLKATVSELTDFLQKSGMSADHIHGDLEQKDRDKVLAKFRNQSIRYLIATDVAARGIDVADLELVFNFDLPAKGEIYVHRIGRTGRAGKTGLAISFATSREKWKVTEIEKLTDSKLIKGNTTDLNKNKTSDTKKTYSNDAEMETLYISGGRKEKVRPGDILGALTGDAGNLQGSDIGKIEIHDHFSYVAVSKKVAALAVQRLNEGKIKGRKFRVGIST